MNPMINVQPQWKQQTEDSQVLRQIYIFQENCRSQRESSLPFVHSYDNDEHNRHGEFFSFFRL